MRNRDGKEVSRIVEEYLQKRDSYGALFARGREGDVEIGELCLYLVTIGVAKSHCGKDSALCSFEI